MSSVVISRNGEARIVCYLQATHRDIHRSLLLLKAPSKDTCCEGKGGGAGRERGIFVTSFFIIAVNYNTCSAGSVFLIIIMA